jgi:HPr kinase/phosphorylase
VSPELQKDGRLHASTVAHAGRAAVIFGPAGSGKSSLALQLMSLGAVLVSDDWTQLTLRGDRLWASAPATIRGKIEARGLGILGAEVLAAAPVALAVDLGQTEDHRLPPERTVALLGVTLPCVHKVEGPHFPAALLQYLKAGRIA